MTPCRTTLPLAHASSFLLGSAKEKEKPRSRSATCFQSLAARYQRSVICGFMGCMVRFWMNKDFSCLSAQTKVLVRDEGAEPGSCRAFRSQYH